ncbi:hypothetical protein [Burkholderia cepacia]|uniref:hypothetical protein n=1 Tax=Burkholderia cepacia TaxID=292 RepID=UPI0012D3F665|nr:hypothetical protein [Burkholderia cepacia]
MSVSDHGKKLMADDLDMESVGEAVALYLAEHPSFLVAANQNLQQEQASAQRQLVQHQVLSRLSDLLRDENTPTMGADNAAVAIVAFIDYHSQSSVRFAAVLSDFVKVHQDVRVVVKAVQSASDTSTPASYAARVGIAVWLESGASGYLAYLRALVARDAPPTRAAITAAAQPHASTSALAAANEDDVSAPLQIDVAASTALSRVLGLREVPAIIVLPQSEANNSNITVLLEGVDADALAQAVNRAANIQ